MASEPLRVKEKKSTLSFVVFLVCFGKTSSSSSQTMPGCRIYDRYDVMGLGALLPFLIGLFFSLIFERYEVCTVLISGWLAVWVLVLFS